MLSDDLDTRPARESPISSRQKGSEVLTPRLQSFCLIQSLLLALAALLGYLATLPQIDNPVRVVCEPIPEACTEQYSPVCGCNDKTYGNECAAAREGVAVGATGECAASASPAPAPAGAELGEGATCGTRGVQGECGSGLYCKYKSQCGATDAGGVCTKRPQMCTKIYKPVCGCDGKTHGSDCVAASQGVAVAHEGECKK